MKRKIRRPISILLALLMVAGLFTAVPITAGAVDLGECSVEGHSLTLNGDIGLNYFIKVDDTDRLAIKNGTKTLEAAFEWETEPAPHTDISACNVTINSENYNDYYKNGYFKVACNVAVAEMSCEINAAFSLCSDNTPEFPSGDSGNPINSVSTPEFTTEETFSVREYADQILDPTSDYSSNTVLVDLVNKLLDYGAKAQTVFGINTAQPANADLDYTMADVTAEDIQNAILSDSENEGKAVSNMAENSDTFGLEYQNSTLVLLSQTSLRHYYTVSEQAVYDEAKEGLQNAEYSERKLPVVYFEISDIPAYELARYQTFTISGQSYNYSAMDYFMTALGDFGVDSTMKDLAKSAYWYYMSARGYFDNACKHDETATREEDRIEATCTENGSYDLVTYCTECGEELSREAKTIEALGHTMEKVNEVLPVGETDGNIAYYKCTVCGNLFFDADGTQPATAEDVILTNVIDLSKVTGNVVAKDGNILKGTLAGNYKISVADNATVTLKDVTVNGVDDYIYQWAGISCPGNATLILEGENNVRGFYENYPGVYIAPDKTLTIKGDGSLNASNNGYAPGIGGGYQINNGNIILEGGTITATSGSETWYSAAIGSGTCGNGGTITIKDTITKVTAIKGRAEQVNHIGCGDPADGSCGAVTIDPSLIDTTSADGLTRTLKSVVDLSKLTGDYTAKDGDILTGTLSGNYKISVSDNATVTLKDVTVNGVDDYIYQWAGISCPGNATLILEGENNVRGFYENYPGVYIAPDKTLTIKGDGSLNASNNGYAPGIGGGYQINNGNIILEGGTITATSGSETWYSAAIGSGTCGNGGTITIKDTITKVTAIKGRAEQVNHIGCGDPADGSCGAVTIDPSLIDTTSADGLTRTIQHGGVG